ncbi:MAG: hypothetical protein EBE86_002600 [Hormoscilla sp. GUM202]|nr:hypothetical protein [Hormoscilla sp. GUM202]
MKPNFQRMTKKDLRAYVLAHRDDDEAFYAYVDKMHEAKAVVYDAVFEWFQGSNPINLVYLDYDILKEDYLLLRAPCSSTGPTF